MSSRKHPRTLSRYHSLTDTFDMTVQAMRDVIRKLPDHQQILLAGKIETLERTHAAFVEEFVCKPQN